jgi:uncharacterized protein (TIGR03067 family)
MRSITFISLAILSCSFTGTKNTAIKSNSLDGTWVPVKQEINGTALPNATFEKQKLIISDSAYTVIAESVDKGVIKYADDKMDIYGKEGVNAGKHYTAIYKFENAQLTICYNLSGNGYPEAFETKGKPMYFLSVFKKDTN